MMSLIIKKERKRKKLQAVTINTELCVEMLQMNASRKPPNMDKS